MDNFDFIADQKFKNLLIRDFGELQECVKNNSSKSVLILSGSIIEAVLIEYFTHNLPVGKTATQVMKMTLADLIDEAREVNLISSKTKELSTVVKNFRNLIHPGREIRLNEEFDEETATVSYHLVKIILKELKQNYIAKYGYKAEDIFNKIIVDPTTHSIYEKLLAKLNLHEKVRLVSMLIDYEMENHESKTKKDYSHYLNLLKPLIGDEQLSKLCKSLVSKVEKENYTQVLALFRIFATDLNLLTTEEKELVLTYIYSIANNIPSWNKNITHSSIRGLFRYFGLYLETPLLREKYFSLLLNIVRTRNSSKENKWYYLSSYRDYISPLSEEKKEKCEKYIADNLSTEITEEFFEALNADDDLPF